MHTTRSYRIATTHACELVDIRRDSDVDEQLVTLVRDAASIAIRAKSDARDKVAVAQRLLDQIASEGAFRGGETAFQPQLLKAIAKPAIDGSLPKVVPPRGSLLSSGLITNAHGESVLDHLASEFATADRISLLCSFIKLSGLDKFRALIERHRAHGRPLRVLTTTYMRATEAKAIELLHRLGADVRISYDDSGADVPVRIVLRAPVEHRPHVASLRLVHIYYRGSTGPRRPKAITDEDQMIFVR